VIFLLGVVQHQVADVSWHSLEGFDQGFLETMAQVDDIIIIIIIITTIISINVIVIAIIRLERTG